MPRDVVTLVNRTKGTKHERVLVYRFDGMEEELQPGENPGVPRNHIENAKLHNKVMGSEEFYNPARFQSYVGVLGTKDDCSPIEFSDEPQVINRTEHNRRTGKTSKIVPADGPTVFDARLHGTGDAVISSGR